MSVQDIDNRVVESKHDEINQFLRHKYTTNCGAETIVKYSQSLGYFFHDYFPQLTPQDAEVHHFEQFLQKLENNYDSKRSVNDSITDRTKHSYLSNISSFYNYALKRPNFPEITANPAQVVLEEIPHNHRDRPDTATWENAVKIVEAMDDPRNTTFTLLLLKTGCRIGEVVNIKQKDVDLDDGWLLIKNRKHGGRTRFPLDLETVQQLKRFQMIRKHPDADHLFTSWNGKPLWEDGVRKKVKQKAKETGVMPEDPDSFYEKFTPHTFRTVFTTVLRDSGMNEHYIKHLRDDSMTGGDMLDHYTKIDEQQVRRSYLKHMPEVNP